MENLHEKTILTLVAAGCLILLAVIVFFLILYVRYHRRIFNEQLKLRESKLQYQQDLLFTGIEAQENERKRIAGDLHDELGAILSMLNINIHQAASYANPRSAGDLAQIKELTTAAITTARRISHELLPPGLETFGLIATLTSNLEGLTTRGWNTSIRHPETVQRLSMPCELGLYRILMELINNTIKHASATHIDIDFMPQGGDLVVKFADNGKGFPENNPAKARGMGMKNIESRIKLLKGTVLFSNGESQGAIVILTLPLH